MIKINEENLKKLFKKGKIVLCAGMVAVCLSGCMSREVSTNANVSYDVIDTMNNDLATTGIQQVLDVPGENFKLVVNYKCVLEDNARWTVTSDKEMYMDVCTDGLDPDTKVFIDNVHIDTTIRSYYPAVDGITQDTMDDRIHNSQMVGFPISDTNTYSNVNVIEGQNESFMSGSYYGFYGYGSGNISQKRYVESDYLRRGVYANKINSVIDLIIEKADGTTTCVSVPSTIGVSVWPYIEQVNSNGVSSFVYYYINSKGEMQTKEYNADEYYSIVKEGKTFGK